MNLSKIYKSINAIECINRNNLHTNEFILELLIKRPIIYYDKSPFLYYCLD